MTNRKLHSSQQGSCSQYGFVFDYLTIWKENKKNIYLARRIHYLSAEQHIKKKTNARKSFGQMKKERKKQRLETQPSIFLVDIKKVTITSEFQRNVE